MKPLTLSFLLRQVLFVCLLAGITAPTFAQDIPVTTNNEQAKALFIEGRELFDNIRFDEARDVFDKALQKDPDFALANVYRAMTSPTDAEFEKHIGNASKTSSQVSDGERLLIESVKANADNVPMKTISILREAIELYPQDKRLHHMLGLAYQGADMDDKAEKQYQKALAIDSDFAPPYNNLGYLYRSSGKFVESENAFKNYIRLLPNEANPHDSIADLYTKMGSHDLAIEHYQRALELNPKFFFSQQKIGDNLIFKGLYADGRRAYQKAIEIAPTTTNKIWLRQSMANTYLYEDDFRRADQESMAAIQLAESESLQENAATLYQLKALMNIERGQFDLAEQDLMACSQIVETGNLTETRKKAVELLALKNWAIKSAKQGDFEKATKKAEKLRLRAEQTEDPYEMQTYHLVKGVISFEKGEYTAAVEQLKKSDPNNPHALYYLAQSYQKAGMGEDARKLFTKVATHNEHSMEYALVRNKARSEAKLDMAVEEQK